MKIITLKHLLFYSLVLLCIDTADSAQNAMGSFDNTLTDGQSKACLTTGATLGLTQLIIDYFSARGVRQFAIWDAFYKNCDLTARARLVRQFSECGMRARWSLASWQTIRGRVRVQLHFVGVVLILKEDFKPQDLIEFLSKDFIQGMFYQHTVWLILSLGPSDTVLEALRHHELGLRFDSDMLVVSMQELQQQMGNILDPTQITLRCPGKDRIRSDILTQVCDLNTQFNCSKSPVMYLDDLVDSIDNLQNIDSVIGATFPMRQVYKVTVNTKSILLEHNYGTYSLELGILKPNFLIVEKRSMGGMPLIFGSVRKGAGTGDAINSNVPTGTIDDVEDAASMNEYMTYFKTAMNATSVVRYFGRLGTYDAKRNEWSDMFGAIVNDEIDMSLDSVIVTPERSHFLYFTYPILYSMRCLYYRDASGGGSLRDVFLRPFSADLVACVLCTGAALSAARAAVVWALGGDDEPPPAGEEAEGWKSSTAGSNGFKFTASEYADYVLGTGATQWFSDGLLFCLELLCLQGTSWSPRSLPGRIILVTGLLFSIVVYNSYAAFITSVLSVSVSDIKTPEQVLEATRQRVGFMDNGQDAVYLLSNQGDNLIKYIYERGRARKEDLTKTVEEGLRLILQREYAFFSSQRAARKALVGMDDYGANCKISEMPIDETYARIAFPMNWNSSYKKAINFSLMRMRENGVWDRIQAEMLPGLPICENTSVFTSAAAQNVASAFVLLVLGMILGTIIVIFENLWKKRIRMPNFRKISGEKMRMK